LEGRGILPKIDTRGYNFIQPVELGKTSTEIGFIVIENTSYTSKLKIHSIEKIMNVGHPEDFDFAPFFVGDLLQKPNITGTDTAIMVTFTPTNTNPSTRFCLVRVESDAMEGPNTDPRKFDTI
jgi:hypothetical protein